MNIANVKLKDFVFLLLTIFIMVQGTIQLYIGIFQYLDEILTILCILYAIYAIMTTKIEKWIKILLLTLILYVIYGVLCNFFGINPGLTTIITDIGNQYKFYITFIGLYLYFKRNGVPKNTVKVVCIIIEVLLLIMIIVLPFNLVHPIELFTYEMRNGLPAYQFIWGHAGILNNLTLYFLMFLTANYGKYRKKKTIMFIAFDLIIMISTLRTRAYVFALLYLTLLFVFGIKNKIYRDLLLFLFVPCIALLVGLDAFQTYFMTSSGARSTLFRTGWELMIQKFPMGYGFGTYGSYAARANYSPLYIKYGFENVYGLSKEFGDFLNDNYWPMIFGQFGIIGVFLTIFLISTMFIRIYKLSKNASKYTTVLSIMFMLIMLINSTASASFSHFTAVGHILFIMTVIFDDKNELLLCEENDYGYSYGFYANI